MRLGSSGLTGVPNHGLVPTPVAANSVRLVFPTMRASAARAPAIHAASVVAGCARSATALHPAVVGVSITSMRSLTARRGPDPPPDIGVMNVVICEYYVATTGQRCGSVEGDSRKPKRQRMKYLRIALPVKGGLQTKEPWWSWGDQIPVR